MIAKLGDIWRICYANFDDFLCAPRNEKQQEKKIDIQTHTQMVSVCIVHKVFDVSTRIIHV